MPSLNAYWMRPADRWTRRSVAGSRSEDMKGSTVWPSELAPSGDIPQQGNLAAVTAAPLAEPEVDIIANALRVGDVLLERLGSTARTERQPLASAATPTIHESETVFAK